MYRFGGGRDRNVQHLEEAIKGFRKNIVGKLGSDEEELIGLCKAIVKKGGYFDNDELELIEKLYKTKTKILGNLASPETVFFDVENLTGFRFADNPARGFHISNGRPEFEKQAYPNLEKSTFFIQYALWSKGWAGVEPSRAMEQYNSIFDCIQCPESSEPEPAMEREIIYRGIAEANLERALGITQMHQQYLEDSGLLSFVKRAFALTYFDNDKYENWIDRIIKTGLGQQDKRVKKILASAPRASPRQCAGLLVEDFAKSLAEEYKEAGLNAKDALLTSRFIFDLYLSKLSPPIKQLKYIGADRDMCACWRGWWNETLKYHDQNADICNAITLQMLKDAGAEYGDILKAEYACANAVSQNAWQMSQEPELLRKNLDGLIKKQSRINDAARKKLRALQVKGLGLA